MSCWASPAQTDAVTENPKGCACLSGQCQAASAYIATETPALLLLQRQLGDRPLSPLCRTFNCAELQGGLVNQVSCCTRLPYSLHGNLSPGGSIEISDAQCWPWPAAVGPAPVIAESLHNHLLINHCETLACRHHHGSHWHYLERHRAATGLCV